MMKTNQNMRYNPTDRQKPLSGTQYLKKDHDIDNKKW